MTDRSVRGPTAWVGTGAEFWRVRVDLFVPDDTAKWVDAAVEGLRPLLAGGDPRSGQGDFGVDQGLGVANRPVVGLLFWVRADDVGQAARHAVETAQRAFAGVVVRPGLYDVTVIPQDAVATIADPHYPSMPD